MGVPEKPENYSAETMIRNAESWKRRQVIKLAAHIWKNNWSVFGPLRKVGRCGSTKLIKGYVRRRMEVIDEQEINNVAQLLHQICLKESSSEIAISIILSFGAWAVHPLHSKFQDVKVPICFLYGTYDWMSRATADQLQKDGQLQEGSSVHTISLAGHQL